MSEAAPIPFSETKAPESPERLHRGALRLVDISASTMANIGPAYSFFFGFAFLVVTAGVAAPLTIIAAGVAIALLGNTLSQFSRARPSTGGFISFVGKTFGGVGQSGLGGRSGGDANIEEFTERRWLTVNTEPAHYPY